MLRLFFLFALLAVALAAPTVLYNIPTTYSVATPYVAAAAPYVYTPTYDIAYKVEPVEHHGYRIAY